MLYIVSFIAGFMIGVIIVALLNGNKQEEIEAELQEIYTKGYELGKKIGYNQGIESMSWRNKK